MKLIISLTHVASICILAFGIEYLSFRVIRFLKFLHTLSLSFFFNTDTILDIHSAYLYNLINLVYRSHFNSSFRCLKPFFMKVIYVA